MCRGEAMIKLLLLGSFATFATRSRTAKEELIYPHAWMKIEIVPFTRTTACTSREEHWIEKNEWQRKGIEPSIIIVGIIAEDKTCAWSSPHHQVFDLLSASAIALRRSRTRIARSSFGVFNTHPLSTNHSKDQLRTVHLSGHLLPTGHPYLNNQFSFIARFSFVQLTSHSWFGIFSVLKENKCKSGRIARIDEKGPRCCLLAAKERWEVKRQSEEKRRSSRSLDERRRSRRLWLR